MQIYTIQSILDWLETNGLIKEKKEAQAFVLTQATVEKLPVATLVLMGVGSLIGLGCIFALLYISKIIDFKNEIQFFITGAIAMALALFSYYGFRNKTSLVQCFGVQSALILMLVGKLLFVFGFAELPGHHAIPLSAKWMITLGLITVTASLYFVFPLRLDRFIFCFLSLCSILINIKNNYFLFIYFIVLVFFTFALFMWRNKSSRWTPLVYAIAITLCLCATNLPMHYISSEVMINIKYYNLVLGIGLIIICLILGKEKKHIIQAPLLSACVGIAILTYFANPGILVSLALLILGRAKYERPLLLLGGVFLCFFIVQYYYTLQYPLDIKAGILVATGIIMLAGSMIIKMMKWHGQAK